jgi:hypothetical protein
LKHFLSHKFYHQKSVSIYFPPHTCHMPRRIITPDTVTGWYLARILLQIASESSVHPTTGHESPEGEYRYSSTLSLTSALEAGGVVNSTPRPLYPRERNPVPIVQEAGWAPGPVWTGAENLASIGIRSPDCPAHSESLYRLSHPGPLQIASADEMWMYYRRLCNGAPHCGFVYLVVSLDIKCERDNGGISLVPPCLGTVTQERGKSGNFCCGMKLFTSQQDMKPDSEAKSSCYVRPYVI